MTEPVLGSSLLQARDSASHPHIPHRNHARSHQRLHNRQDSDSIVHVIQTVSVIQFIDSTGAIVDVETQLPDLTTTSTHAEPTITTVNEPGIAAVSGDDAADLLSSSSLISTTTTSSVDSSMSPSFPTVESFAPITSAPSSGSSPFPTFSGVSNSTQAATSSSLISSNAPSTSKSFQGFNLTTSYLPNSSGTVLYNSSFTTTLGQLGASSITVIESSSGTATSSSADGAIGGGSSGASPSSTSTANGDAGSSSSTPPASTVAGGVLGGVAGIALILVATLMLLRWKKRQNTLKLEGGRRGSRGLLVGEGGGGPGSQPRGMSETLDGRSIPFAVPAALARLSGSYNRSSQRTADTSEGGERGFQKISGRKLPSVLQHGGDGFTNPFSDPADAHASTMSETSFYRDSQGFYGGTGVQLAVGSPMRPHSTSVPILHPSPARTPVTTEFGQFSIPLTPPPNRDELGRSPPSQDGSNASNRSRFMEEI